MTVCHDARKGRTIGSHWPNHVAPPLHSTSSPATIALTEIEPGFLTKTEPAWKSALSSCALPKPFGASFDAGAAVHPFLPIFHFPRLALPQVS